MKSSQLFKGQVCKTQVPEMTTNKLVFPLELGFENNEISSQNCYLNPVPHIAEKQFLFVESKNIKIAPTKAEARESLK